MNNEQIGRVVCERMGPHDATVLYSGVICQTGAAALQQQLESLFDYYQYNRIELRLESPGGSVEALQYMLRQISRYEGQGRAVAVRTTFLCASAAAILLAMGAWGERCVDRATALLFHSARVGSNVQGLTATVSSNLSQVLQGADRHLVDILVDRMVRQTGSTQALANMVHARCQRVEYNWSQLSSHLYAFTPESEGKRRPEWLRSLAKIACTGVAGGKFASELKKHLQIRFERDVRMDVREAYVLCLIDEVEGVLQDKAADVDGLTSPVDVQELRLSAADAICRPAC